MHGAQCSMGYARSILRTHSAGSQLGGFRADGGWGRYRRKEEAWEGKGVIRGQGAAGGVVWPCWGSVFILSSADTTLFTASPSQTDFNTD